MANKENVKEICMGTREDKASGLAPERLLSCHPFLYSPLLILFHCPLDRRPFKAVWAENLSWFSEWGLSQ